MIPHAIIQATLPVRAAGGGQPSTEMKKFSLTPFSESVLGSLVTSHKGLVSQDGQDFADESTFLTYMASDKSNAMCDPKNNDLGHPMSSYYISSSHNTYLSGHQLYGEASTEAYTNVLKRGCRCLEIDVWDGDSDSEASSSDDDDERESKPSRWNRVKARAARMRSRSRSGSLNASGPPSAGAQGQSENGMSPRPTEASSYKSNFLSPQVSPTIPAKSEPRVLHGYTLTQSITFRSVCHAIRESAFVSTDLPLIVSLEVHASLTQQEVMVEIMREIWSDYLVCLDKEGDVSALPSPQSLKGKILIKVKWAPHSETGESNDPIDHVASNSTDGVGDGPPPSPEKRKKASKVLAALSALGVYTRAYTFKHFSQPEATIPTHVFSLSENKVHNMHADPEHGPAMFDHNRHYLMRVFPKGTRINSSNVDPTFHWRQGAQMVALNWQKMDKAMMLNEGMFAGLGGWALKPERYRCDHSKDDPDSHKVVEPQTQLLDLDIRILAAQRLPFTVDKDPSHAAKMKPYVKAQLHVGPHGPANHLKSTNSSGNLRIEGEAYPSEEADKKFYKRRTATYRSENPDFGGEMMSWQNVPDVVEELSFLRYVHFSFTPGVIGILHAILTASFGLVWPCLYLFFILLLQCVAQSFLPRRPFPSLAAGCISCPRSYVRSGW